MILLSGTNNTLDKLKSNKQIKFGIILILLSGVAFAIMLIIPFLNFEKQTKILGASIAFIAMEVLFYVGGFFVGKELFSKYKNYLNPVKWFKGRSANKE